MQGKRVERGGDEGEMMKWEGDEVEDDEGEEYEGEE